MLLKLSFVLALAGHGADLASTEHCLGRGVCREMNPWLARFEQPAIFGAAKMGVAGAGLWATSEFAKSHPKWATVLNLTIAGAYTGIAIHNSRVAK